MVNCTGITFVKICFFPPPSLPSREVGIFFFGGGYRYPRGLSWKFDKINIDYPLMLKGECQQKVNWQQYIWSFQLLKSKCWSFMKIRSAAGGCSLSMRRKRDKFSKIKHHTQLSAGYQSIKHGYNLSCVHCNWWRETKNRRRKLSPAIVLLTLAASIFKSVLFKN